VRWIGLVAALVVVALAAGAALVGYRQGQDDLPTPTSFSAAPVPAVRPSYPVTPARVVPDDDYPALEPGVALHPVKLGSAPFQVRVPVPKGWVRNDSTAGETKWFPAVDAMDNVYFIRVRLVGANYDSVQVAMQKRLAALDNASDVADLTIERREPDRFVANYVAYEHRRVAFEGFLPRSDVAFVYIAVVGRAVDRAGLADLFSRMMKGSRTTVG
jgi:hypothetical protein